MCKSGKSKSLGGCGSAATAGLPDNARPVFSDKIARVVRSLSERNEIPSNYQKCPRASGVLKHGPVLAGASMSNPLIAAPNAAEWSGRIRPE